MLDEPPLGAGRTPLDPHEASPGGARGGAAPERDPEPRGLAGPPAADPDSAGSLEAARLALDAALSEAGAVDERSLARLLHVEAQLLALEVARVKALGSGVDGGSAGCPVRSTAAEWRDLLAAGGLTREAAAADQVVMQLDLARLRATTHAASPCAPSPGAPSPVAPAVSTGNHESPEALGAAFEALLAVDELSAAYQVKPRALAVEPGVVDSAAVLAEAREARTAARSHVAAYVARGVVPEVTRARWVELAIDAADEALFAAGEVAPHVAAERLDRAADALAWHSDALTLAGDRALRRRLARARGRLESEREEQLLTALLARRFGARNVGRWDRAVLGALLVVLGLLVFELFHGATVWSMRVDHALCAFFLWDFSVRAWLIGFRRRWMTRHFVTDFLPALPWSWFFAGGAAGAAATAEPARLAWFLRLVRLPRMAQSARLLMPLMRLVRALGFLARGLDRLVRSHRRLLEQEVLLFPTSAERRAAASREHAQQSGLFELRARLDARFAAGLATEARAQVAEARTRHLASSDAALIAPFGAQGERRPRRAERPLAEDLLARLENVSAAEVEDHLGEASVRRAARGVRLFVRSPLRYLPLARAWVPRESLSRPDHDVVAGTVRAVARSLARQHQRVLWWADLATTITPAELVGRVGATIVARTARPAVRLLVIAGAYGLLSLLLQVIGAVGVIATLVAMAENMIGKPLLVLGTVCLALLAVGAWLQRLARDASTFQEQVASAQFLHLTDSIKARDRSGDARLLAQRVFAPEFALRRTEIERDSDLAEPTDSLAARFLADLSSFRGEGLEICASSEHYDPVGRAVLLYRDYQDGALFVESDTRATGQLLGNLALRRLIERSGRLSSEAVATLSRIDLRRRKSVFDGPYLWFHAITRSLASRAARLIVEFNANAVPLADLAHCAPEERGRYEAWLAGGSSEPASRREEALRQLTTAFTVLHFLDASPGRDDEVERRFGPRVRARLERERRGLVRSVLGCWPLAYRPIEERVLNVRALYEEWLSGGRVLILPLRLVGRGLRLAGFMGGRLVEAVQIIRRPDRPLGAGRPQQADFATALRKVDRMRLPAAWEALRLRALFDPEYLGFARRAAPLCGVHTLERDLEFLRAEPALVAEVEEARARTARDLAWLERALEGGLRARLEARLGVQLHADPERERALILAFHADLDGVRAYLAGEAVVVAAAREALLSSLGPRWFVRPGLRGRVSRWWARRGIAASGETDPAALERLRSAVWVAISQDLDGARAAFEAVEVDPAAAAQLGEDRLTALLRHPGQLSEQLTTLRTIQTITLVDVRNYRSHIHRLGQYELEDPREEWQRELTL
ncbi:MAG: hypothetical protein R3F49_19995 [Planctomycetota bacterium]